MDHRPEGETFFKTDYITQKTLSYTGIRKNLFKGTEKHLS